MASMLHKVAYKTLSGFMAIWLSGIVFLLCCEMPGDDAENARTQMDSMSEHCRRAMSKKNPGHAIELPDYDTFDCCGFLPGIFDKNRKLSRIDQPDADLTLQISARLNVARGVNFRQPVIVRSEPYIPDRQSTFLKNQVFRI